MNNTITARQINETTATGRSVTRYVVTHHDATGYPQVLHYCDSKRAAVKLSKSESDARGYYAPMNLIPTRAH